MQGPEVNAECLPPLPCDLIFLRQTFSLNLELINWLGWLAITHRAPPVFASPELVFHAQLFIWLLQIQIHLPSPPRLPPCPLLILLCLVRCSHLYGGCLLTVRSEAVPFLAPILDLFSGNVTMFSFLW